MVRRGEMRAQSDALTAPNLAQGNLPHPLSDDPAALAERRQSSLDNWTHDTPSAARRLSDMSIEFTGTDTFSQAQPSEQVAARCVRARERSGDDRGLSDEDRRRGYRLLDRPDVRYLGFVPSRNDKRPYLNAVAVVGKVPDENIFGFNSPVSSTQVWTYIIFILLIAIAGAASYFYIRNVESEALDTPSKGTS